MEHDFWHNKWEVKQTGFHLDYIHPILKRSINLFTPKQTVFVPLCGKSLDIGYPVSYTHLTLPTSDLV